MSKVLFKSRNQLWTHSGRYVCISLATGTSIRRKLWTLQCNSANEQNGNDRKDCQMSCSKLEISLKRMQFSKWIGKEESKKNEEDLQMSQNQRWTYSVRYVYLWQLKLGFEAILCTLQCNSANDLGSRKNINKMKKMYKDCAMTFKVFTQLIK